MSAIAVEKRSPDAVAAFVEWLLQSSGWTVRVDDGTRRALAANDVCILFRSMISSRGEDRSQAYVRALEMRGIEHVLVGSRSFHEREEIGAVRTAMRAIEWPDDELAVYAVLRGPMFFVSDEDLFKFRSQYGRLTPFFRPPEDMDPAFQPVANVLDHLQSLHRRRNYRPPAETIRLLLDAARAHIGMALHPGGERRLANVYRLCDLARNFEATRPGSFRSFVDYLESEYDSRDQSDAVIEQQSGGVQLMSVHKAKGLEFPVVILADMTTHATRQGKCDRYVDAGKSLCAQRLCGWSPWELLDHMDAEDEEDRAESVRLAYVAATRAKDLLVVTASGMSPWEGSWLGPLYGALYPPAQHWTTPESYPHVPTRGFTTVPEFPDGAPVIAIRPGMHRSEGGNRVFWFDPALLRPASEDEIGAERGIMLQDRDAATTQAGLDAWQRWQNDRRALIATAKQPSVVTVPASLARAVPELDAIPCDVIASCWEGQRPATRQFGRLVHALLETWDAERARQIAPSLARRIGATEDETRIALAVALDALHNEALKLDRAKTIHREYPVAVALSTGEIAEGVIDLAWSDGETWTVVDYKTGVVEPQHRRQVKVYALALQRATGLPARAIILDL